MELTRHKHLTDWGNTYVLDISANDYDKMKLSPMDRAIIDDCSKKDSTIADKLLGLELIARRIEEADG